MATPTSGNGIPRRIRSEIIDRLFATMDAYGSEMNCVIKLAGTLDAELLERAVRWTMDVEPILGCVFREHWLWPFWERRDDLDQIKHTVIEPIDAADVEQRVLEFLAAPLARPVEVVLLRAEADTLLLKFDHKIGDVHAMKDYAGLLAHSYTSLLREPAAVARPNPVGSRATAQLFQTFDVRRRREVDRWRRAKLEKRSRAGRWRFPVPPAGNVRRGFVLRHLDAARVKAIFRFALRQRATVHHVIAAAYLAAAARTLDQRDGPRLPLLMWVDLRRYLPEKKSGTYCNLVGGSVLLVDTTADLAGMITEVREQLNADRVANCLGLEVSSVGIDTRWLRRSLLEAAPFAGFRAVLNQMRKRAQRQPVPGGPMILTNCGEVDCSTLQFGEQETRDAFVTSGVVSAPGMRLCLSTSESGINLSAGFDGAWILPETVERLLDRLVEQLPDTSESQNSRHAK